MAALIPWIVVAAALGAAAVSANDEGSEVPAPGLILASAGKPLATIVLATDAVPAEENAARELAHYLGLITSASFEIVGEGTAPPSGIRIHVGPTGLSLREASCATRRPEEWVILGRDEDLILCGGRPRGTLYAVYRFLEDHLGVRWWTPWEETVPRREELVLPLIDESGEPAFPFREVYLAAHGPEPQRFAVRNRINGDFSALTPDWGGRYAFGPPHHVHTFFMYAKPGELFDEHPEYFTGLEEKDAKARGSLCLTDPGLRRHVERQLRSYIEQSTKSAKEQGDTPPTLFSFSHNDWIGVCDCESCLPLVEREGESGALIEIVNELAASIEGDYPGVRLETLAYRETVEPPATLRLRPDVVLRLADLFAQDFTRPITDPVNSFYRRVLGEWLERSSHLWVWEYTTTFSWGGGLPLANLHVLAANFRYYLDHGVEGVFAQHDHMILADMRYLGQWVIARLIEDPGRDPNALIREFTDGYYGAAGGLVRDYLLRLERAMTLKPAHIGYPNRIEDWSYLDAAFLVDAQALFDRAEQAMVGNPVGLRRVRYARLSLDRATLMRWPFEFGDRKAKPPGLDPREIARRARQTAYDEIDAHITGGEVERQRELIDKQVDEALERIGYR